MSRRVLARHIGFIVGPDAIVRYETTTISPTMDTVLRMANALGVNIEDLTDAPR